MYQSDIEQEPASAWHAWSPDKTRTWSWQSSQHVRPETWSSIYRIAGEQLLLLGLLYKSNLRVADATTKVPQEVRLARWVIESAQS